MGLIEFIGKSGVTGVKGARWSSKQVRMFSTEGKDIEEEFEEITEEEKQKYRDAWGLKFNDE